MTTIKIRYIATANNDITEDALTNDVNEDNLTNYPFECLSDQKMLPSIKICFEQIYIQIPVVATPKLMHKAHIDNEKSQCWLISTSP